MTSPMSPAERAAALALGDPYFEYLNVSRWEMPFRVVQAMLREIMFHPRRGCTIPFSTVERRVASYPWFTQEDEVSCLEVALRAAEARAEKAEAGCAEMKLELEQLSMEWHKDRKHGGLYYGCDFELCKRTKNLIACTLPFFYICGMCTRTADMFCPIFGTNK